MSPRQQCPCPPSPSSAAAPLYLVWEDFWSQMRKQTVSVHTGPLMLVLGLVFLMSLNQQGREETFPLMRGIHPRHFVAECHHHRCQYLLGGRHSVHSYPEVAVAVHNITLEK